ncbi:hypothetical protein [Maridesulfovibrio sp.]|uniref:hypothetical protein n=1 Tax=Maridesulfovibrio sp. TaxID=2795000 RepID=UPI003BABEFC1
MKKPQDSKVVGIPHFHTDIDPKNANVEDYYPYMVILAGCDYMILGHQNLSRFAGKDFEHILGIVPEEYHLPESHSTIIPAGYPSLDVLEESISNSQVEQDSILYAPTYNYVQTEKDSQDTISILETLAQKFPDKQIVFRPLPNSQARHEGKVLFEKLKSKNVSLDLSNNNPEQYARAALVVTDTSTTADTFSYATLRPHIQCQMHGFKKESTSKGTGWVAYSLEQFNQILNSLDLDSGAYADEILKQRNEQFCSVGRTAANVIDHIETICNGDNCESWLKVPRRIDRSLRDSNDKDLLQEILKTKPGPRKASYITCAEAYSNCSSQPRSYADLFNWYKAHQPLNRENAHNLTCFLMQDKTIQIIDSSDFHETNPQRMNIPFYLNCGQDTSIDDFTFSADIIKTSFAGYTGTNTEEKNNHVPLQEIISNQERAYIAIGNDTMYSRMATSFDLYCLARQNGLEIISPKVLHYIAVEITPQKTVNLLQAWQCREKAKSNNSEPFMIWGSSGYYQQLKTNNELPDMARCLGFIDSNKDSQGTTVDAKTVYSLQEALRVAKYPFTIIIAASYIYHDEIIATLREELARMTPNSTLAHPRKDGY